MNTGAMGKTAKADDGWLLDASDLSLDFAGRTVLDHVSLRIDPKEIITVIGPNGAGKSSLLRVLIGTQKASAGRVRRKPGLRLGYMPQRLEIRRTLPLTVRRFLQLAPDVDPQAINEALEETGVADLASTQMATLSGGETQRVLLARAILRRPDLLLLDEPTRGVDHLGEARLYALIIELRRRLGCAILMVSHDLHLVMGATDRVVCLNRHVCCTGSPGEVSVHPSYLNLFGSETRILAPYAHDHDHTHDHTRDHTHGHDPRQEPVQDPGKNPAGIVP